MLSGCKNLISTQKFMGKMLKSYLLDTWLLDLASFSLGHWGLTLHNLSLTALSVAELEKTAGMGQKGTLQGIPLSL